MDRVLAQGRFLKEFLIQRDLPRNYRFALNMSRYTKSGGTDSTGNRLLHRHYARSCFFCTYRAMQSESPYLILFRMPAGPRSTKLA